MINGTVRTLAVLLLFPLHAFSQQGTSVTTAIVDAFVNRDGSVALSYEVDLKNAADAPSLTSFTLSLPSSHLDMERIHAYRCDPENSTTAEQSAETPVESEGAARSPLPVHRHPDPDLDSDVVLDLSNNPLGPGEAASLCLETVIPDYVSKDFLCSGSAYTSMRPTLYYGGKGELSDVYVTIHLPEGIPPELVLAQQEWPQNEIQYSLPVQEENGRAVVRWNARKSLREIYWIAAIFPEQGIKTRKAFDGLQTDERMVPLETLNLDASVQLDGQVALVYELEIENAGGCQPVESVQIVLPGKPQSIAASVNGNAVPINPHTDIYDKLWPYLGDHWYKAYNVSLGRESIAPGKKGVVRVEAQILDEVRLLDPEEKTAWIELNPTASVSGCWAQGSHWTTRVHLPAGMSEDQVHSIASQLTRKEMNEGRVDVTWEETKAPSPVDLSFPVETITNVQWDLDNTQQWIFVLSHSSQFPGLQSILRNVGIFLSPIAILIGIGLFRKFRRR